MIKSPVDVTIDGIRWGGEKVGEMAFNYLKENITALGLEYLEAVPILAGMSIATYALFNMVSRSLANLSVFGVFAYGGLVVLVT